MTPVALSLGSVGECVSLGVGSAGHVCYVVVASLRSSKPLTVSKFICLSVSEPVQRIILSFLDKEYSAI